MIKNVFWKAHNSNRMKSNGWKHINTNQTGYNLQTDPKINETKPSDSKTSRKIKSLKSPEFQLHKLLIPLSLA